ncbi:beta-glucosidase 42-like isoform X1 [Papaver somniferum]|uniref:beta-glucosidase 42-like isoform X1 n=1 Tax=Papaver somniferum TaxID=3469 RepID=UPI000E6FBDB5|nr:beta-glucosidase 42-like isoform X1 [Papaver somniferum]
MASKFMDEKISCNDLPLDFVFGVATSAYQVEGASNEGGRGDSIWDVFTHTEGKIKDGSNGDIAVDQYHLYKEDVELMSKLGFGAYRFSVSWSRIFPDGLGTEVNEEGITYYNNLINALLDKGMQPYLTLYHWDLPSHLHESMGGWLSGKIVKYFAMYAETCFASFGDRVKHWITLNEPLQTAVNGYDNGTFAPGRSENSSTEPYLAAHHQLLAHAAAVSIYNKKYKAQQGGEIGIVADCEWAEAFSDKMEDKTAAARRIDFHFGWFLDPIYFGDYPKSMREELGDLLPKFSDEDRELLRNSVDFLGVNNYTTRLIAHATTSPDPGQFNRSQHLERIAEYPGGEAIGEKAASEWLYIVPWGLRKLLNYVAQKYQNPKIYITENGMDDEGDPKALLHEMLDDKKRVGYYKGYLAAVSQAIKDGVDVRGYFAWSFLDNFEWAQGYTKRFGIVYVDYKNGLTRHPKSSALWFSRFLKGDEGKTIKED